MSDVVAVMLEGSGRVIVVSDTTPLISLMKIGRLSLIEQLFGEVQIPGAVYAELISNSEFKKEAHQRQAFQTIT